MYIYCNKNTGQNCEDTSKSFKNVAELKCTYEGESNVNLKYFF